MPKTLLPSIRSDADRNRLVMANIGLVYTMVGIYYRKHPLSIHYYFREDAEAEGKVGLIRAAELFDDGNGTRFSTYACWWIRQAIDRGAEESRFIRTPRSRAIEQGRLDKFGEFRERAGRVFLSPPDLPGGDEDGGWDGADESASVEDNVCRNELRQAVTDLLRFFNPQQREILFRRYWQDHTLDDIADDMGITKERIRQIQNQCLDKMKFLLCQKKVREDRFV